VEKIGSLNGPLELCFLFKDGGMLGKPQNASNYKLIYRTGLSGNFTDVPTAATFLNGDTSGVTFQITEANLVNGYYTIGTTDAALSPLPVTLGSFTAGVHKNSVQLSWTTVSEINNYGFEIERRKTSAVQTDFSEQDWKKIGFVEGAGSTTQEQSYVFHDSKAEGILQYRLKQIDRTGESRYSKTIEVHFESAIEVSLSQNYPNPFNPVSKIYYSLSRDEDVLITLYDILGRFCMVLKDSREGAGQHAVTIDASALNAGMYFYTLRANGHLLTKKMTVVK
jgi:hypothetical protein